MHIMISIIKQNRKLSVFFLNCFKMSSISDVEKIKSEIRTIQDFPKPGIPFKDIFPIFKKPDLVKRLVSLLVAKAKAIANGKSIDVVVGLDARGFLVGPMVAIELGASFVPVRKQGKLPGETISVAYELEYRKDVVELQKEAIANNQNAIIIDDLLATGGTLDAACRLVKKLGGNVIASIVIVELSYLQGRKLAERYGPVVSLLQYSEAD